MVVREEQRVAIGRRCLERLRRDLSAGAGAVLDHHRHAQHVLEFFAQRACDGVGARARGKAHQDADGRALRLRKAGEAHGR